MVNKPQNWVGSPPQPGQWVGSPMVMIYGAGVGADPMQPVSPLAPFYPGTVTVFPSPAQLDTEELKQLIQRLSDDIARLEEKIEAGVNVRIIEMMATAKKKKKQSKRKSK